jgi:predicted nucleic acid-binding protein
MYVLDTNIYIDAVRSDQVRALFSAFMARHGAHTLLSTIVLHELQVGARTASERWALDRTILEPSRSSDRLLEVDALTWGEASGIVRALQRGRGNPEQLRLASFRFDILLAASCRRVGATLITANVSDFAAINAVRGIRCVNHFPA